MHEFEKTVRNILFLIRNYAAETYIQKNANDETFNFQRFAVLCRDGYKKAQEMILSELIENQKNRNSLKVELKEVRRNKEKEKTTEIEEKINFLEYQDDIFRNLAFTIAWLMFSGKREILARFYTEDEGEKQLEGKGFEAILDAANEINKDSNKFCLILDLTNNLQVGDLLVETEEGYEIVEVKTGKKNEEAKRVLEFDKLNRIEIDEQRLSDIHGKKLAKQILRMHEQDKRRGRIKDIAENDFGKDPKHDIEIKLPESMFIEETYHDEINKLLLASKNRDWAYANVEGIVNIGVYKRKWKLFGPHILKNSNKDCPIHDILSGRKITICEPLFAKPFPEDDIIDIAMGKTKVFIGLDLELIVQFLNDFGLPVRWSTRKELNAIFDKTPFKSREIFSHKNRGLVIENQKNKAKHYFIGNGMMVRILFDHILPSIIVQNRANNLPDL